MPSSTSSSEHPTIRVVPDHPWGRLTLIVAIGVALAVSGWEWHCRARGYEPGLDDTSDLWVEARRSVQSDSTVIIGSSRSLFDLDLDLLEKGLGRRPVQLALVGSCAYPMLRHLADDPTFHGTVICDIVPSLLLVPSMAPPYKNAEKAIRRYQTQTWAQRSGQLLSLPLEYTFGAMQQDDLTLSALLRDLPIPDRPKAQVGPRLPPCFSTIDRDRRTRMKERVLTDQVLRDRIKFGWPPLFTPPPKPSWIPDAAYADFMGKLFNGRFDEMAKAVADLRARGARVVFLRLPNSGELHELESRLTPRAAVWDRLITATGCPGVHFEDHEELTGFECPEWSHLSAADSVTVTTRLTPILAGLLAPATP